MPRLIIRLMLACGALLAAGVTASAQADVALRAHVPAVAAADVPLRAYVTLTNEGSAAREALVVAVRPTASLFFVAARASAGTFDPATMHWHVGHLAAGRTDTLFLDLQPNAGGIHALAAEVVAADTPDWDSTPGNGDAREDDQDEACLTVPLQLSCGQFAVLRAPSGKTDYTWYRNDTLLAYATADTLHPSTSGDYRYEIRGESCAKRDGSCCPVRIERAGCIHDLALVATTVALDDAGQRQRVTLHLYNEGAGPVSRIGLYVTTSAYARLTPADLNGGWQPSGDRVRRDWNGHLPAGDSTTVSFTVETLSGGSLADYTLFAEIAEFFSGSRRLVDVDSAPDSDPRNDAVVDDGRRLARTTDEDDSDIAILTSCRLSVFAEAGYVVATDPATGGLAAGAYACVPGTLQDLAAYSYHLGDRTLAAPTLGCDPVGIAKFSLRGLPANYTDNGWRIESYTVAGEDRIRGRTVNSLAEVMDAIRATHPGATVNLDRERGYFEVDGYAKAPERLSLRHLATGSGINVQPLLINSFRGFRLVLPTGLRVGTYTLIARATDGCESTAPLVVEAGTQQLVLRDTVRLSGEVGDPLYVGALTGFSPETAGTWTPLADGFVVTPARAGTQVTQFVNAGAAPRHERLVVAEIAERKCGPLAVTPTVTVTPSTCTPQTIPLGLTRKGSTVFASSGQISGLTRATGQRPGAAYRTLNLPHQGLSGRYTVVTWPGHPAAAGVSGNLPDLLRELRRRGIDAYANWAASTIYVAGATQQPASLRDAAGQTLTLTPVATTLETYGSLYLQSGTSRVTVGVGTCQSVVEVKIDCKQRAPLPGGIFVLDAGSVSDVPRASLPGGSSAASVQVTKVPMGIWAELDPTGTGLRVKSDGLSLGDHIVSVEVCDAAGVCQPVALTIRVEPVDELGPEPCLVEIWRDEMADLLVGPGGQPGVLYVPAGFDLASDSLFVDGKLAHRALAQRTLASARQYTLAPGLTALRTPSGKTVSLGSVAEAAAAARQVFAKAQSRGVNDQLTVSGLDSDESLYGRAADGTWAALPFVVLAEESRATLALSPGEHLVEIVRGGCRDAITVRVRRAPFAEERAKVELTAGGSTTYCLPETRPGVPVVEVVNVCDRASGERASAMVDGSCVRIDGHEAGAEQLCLRRVYIDGGIDSITLAVVVAPRRRLAARADRDSIEFGAFTVIEVLANDELLDEPRSLSLLSDPYFGRAQVVSNTAIEYLHHGSECVKDVFSYEICQGDRCETATVEIEVKCDELLVYNGLSPNGDGVNEEFTITGLGRYPDHEITIFGRDGRLVTVLRDYASDWRGDVAGVPLPEGTYFYVIDLGNGETRSGYLQISR